VSGGRRGKARLCAIAECGYADAGEEAAADAWFAGLLKVPSLVLAN